MNFKTVFTALAISGLLVAATGCGNKCDELADELEACGSGSGGGETGETTEAECTEAQEKCAGCLLDSGEDLCTLEGLAAAATSCASDCS